MRSRWHCSAAIFHHSFIGVLAFSPTPGERLTSPFGRLLTRHERCHRRGGYCAYLSPQNVPADTLSRSMDFSKLLTKPTDIPQRSLRLKVNNCVSRAPIRSE